MRAHVPHKRLIVCFGSHRHRMINDDKLIYEVVTSVWGWGESVVDRRWVRVLIF